MNVRQLVAVCLLLGLLFAAATAHSAPIPEGWKHLFCSNRAQEDDAVSFQVYLKHQNTDLLEEYLASQHSGIASARLQEHVIAPLAAHVEQKPEELPLISHKLAFWRGLMQPDDAHTAAVKSWLSAAKPDACTFDWDFVKCDDVPVRTAERLFGTRFCAFEENNERHLWFPVKQTSLDIVLLEDMQSVGSVPVGIEQIRGIQPYDPKTKFPTHFHKLAQGQAEKLKQQRRSEVMPSFGDLYDVLDAPVATETDIGAGEAVPSYWPLDYHTQAPSVTFFGSFMAPNNTMTDENFMNISLKCQNGHPAFMDDSKTPSGKWCADASDVPVHIDISLEYPAPIADKEKKPSVYTFDGKDFYKRCDPGYMTPTRVAGSVPYHPDRSLINKTSDHGRNVICSFLIPDLSSQPLWAELRLKVRSCWAAKSQDVQTCSGWSTAANWQANQTFTAYNRDNKLALSEARPIVNGINLPDDISAMYGIPTSIAAGDNQQPDLAQGILEFSYPIQPGHGFHRDDLEKFLVLTKQLPNMKAAEAYVDKWLVEVTKEKSASMGETTLDVDMMMSVSPDTKTYLWNLLAGPGTSFQSSTDVFLSWGQNVTSAASPLVKQPSAVWSISYGFYPQDPASGKIWATRLNKYFGMLSASNVAVFASSGDSGSGDYNPPWATMAPYTTMPSTASHVVGVGATSLRLQNPEEVSAGTAKPDVHEIVCSAQNDNIITTGGGFAEDFDVPAHQKTFVDGYIAEQKKVFGDKVGFPPNRRGVPDIAMLGAWILVILDGQEVPVFGTSASSPIAGALFSQLNKRRAGGTIGAAPEFLYWANAQKGGAKAFNDIDPAVSGGAPNNCQIVGGIFPMFPTWPSTSCFAAGKGWDANTGLGSLNFEPLLTHAKDWQSKAPKQKIPAWKAALAIIGGLLFFATAVGTIHMCYKRHAAEESDYESLE